MKRFHMEQKREDVIQHEAKFDKQDAPPVEQISDDMANRVEEWLRQELTKILGKEAVDGIANRDYDSVFKAQSEKMLWLDRSYTVRKDGGLYYFYLKQGPKDKHIVLSEFIYELKFNFNDQEAG